MDLKYPIGTYEAPSVITQDIFDSWVHTLEDFPKTLKKELEALDASKLGSCYRENGWTIRQVVHHLADSHINSFIRFKLMMTEDTPTIRPYLQDKWALTHDGDNDEIGDSIDILKGIHARLVRLLRSLDAGQKKRTFYHPEYPDQKLHLEWMVGLYAWHCSHHLAHIQLAKQSD